MALALITPDGGPPQSYRFMHGVPIPEGYYAEDSSSETTTMPFQIDVASAVAIANSAHHAWLQQIEATYQRDIAAASDQATANAVVAARDAARLASQAQLTADLALIESVRHEDRPTDPVRGGGGRAPTSRTFESRELAEEAIAAVANPELARGMIAVPVKLA